MIRHFTIGLCWCLISISVSAVTYTITDLGTLGGAFSGPSSVNDSGQVVGSSSIGGPYDSHAFFYDNGVMIDIGTLGGEDSVASAINNSGQIAGNSEYNWSPHEHAFFYDNGVMTDLGTLGGIISKATCINESGQVVGESHLESNQEWHAFLYDGIKMIDLGTLGGKYSFASAINNCGQVVGSSNISRDPDYDHITHSFIYDGTSMKELDTFEATYSLAIDINDKGQVVGHCMMSISLSNYHAFFYDGNKVIDIGTLGGDNSYAYGINNRGQVVGRSQVHGSSSLGDLYAFVYDKVRGMQNLNDLIPPDSGWLLKQAIDINSSGQIVGQGKIGGQNHAYLLTPIPETVYIDIKPQSCPNPLNVKSKGMLSVAILGSAVFDVNDIDIASIEILGVRLVRSSMEDVATPVAEESLPEDCLCTTEGPDGYMDLTLKFDKQAIVEAIGEVEDEDYVILTLTGFLKDGTPIEGTDCVRILKKGRVK